MKKYILFLILITLLFALNVQAFPPTGSSTTINGMTGGVVTGDSNFVGCVGNTNPAPNYKSMADLLNVFDDAGASCSLLLGFLNVGAGNTEINQCNTTAGNATYCNAVAGACPVDSLWTSADQETVGQSYVLDFDGVNDMIAIPDNTAFTLDGNFTIGFMLSLDAVATEQTFIFSKAGQGVAEYTIRVPNSSTKIELWVRDISADAFALVTLSYNLTPNQLYFVVFTHDEAVGSGATWSTGTKIYIDTVEDTGLIRTTEAGFVDMEDLGGNFNIGANYSGSVPTAMKMAKPFILKGTALSQAQINRANLIMRANVCQ